MIDPAASFGGDDRFVSEYVESEFLARISSSQRQFLTRTAALERMSGPLCEAVLEVPGSGTLQYEIYFSDDQSECIVLERYRDSEALIEHAAHLGELGRAIFATGWVSGELLGEPSAELTAMMAGSGVRLFRPFLSM